MSIRITITGSTGYVGSQLVTRLARRGIMVRPLARRDAKIAGIAAAIGDLSDVSFVRNSFQDTDVFLHCAALTRSRDPAVLAASNEAPTKVIAAISREFPQVKLIYISSDQAVYLTGAYGRSKRNCEAIVAEHAQNYCILRLSAVLGQYRPDMDSTFSKIVRTIHRMRVIPLIDNGRNSIAPVSIKDVEAAIVKLADRKKLNGDVLEVVGPVGTLAELVNAVEKRLGHKCLKVSLPIGLIQWIARHLQKFSAFKNLPLDAVLDLGQPIRVSPKKLTSELGIVPLSISEAVAEIEDFPLASGEKAPHL